MRTVWTIVVGCWNVWVTTTVWTLVEVTTAVCVTTAVFVFVTLSILVLVFTTFVLMGLPATLVVTGWVSVYQASISSGSVVQNTWSNSQP